MNTPGDGSQKWFLFLVIGSLFGATLLRGLIQYWGSNELLRVLLTMGAWLVIFILEPRVTKRYVWFFPVYLMIQSGLVVSILMIGKYQLGSSDYFAVLFAILSIQIIRRYDLRRSILLIALFTPAMIIGLSLSEYASQAASFALLYTAGNALYSSYAFATRRSQEAHARNQALMIEVQEANRQLKSYSEQVEQLSAARERGRLARELHDSVTQTLFSINLNTQSAILLYQNDPSKVNAQLDRLAELTQNALAEMQVLISELRPQRIVRAGLASELRQHLSERHFPEGFTYTLEVDGDQQLSSAEEDSLFRIAQEAVNNIVKHAQADWACIHLHLSEPYWMEIEDHGQGFELSQPKRSGKVGLSSMRERAAEIGWSLQVISSPGAGTRIRVEKSSPTRRPE